MLNTTEFINGAANLTTQSDFLEYASKNLFFDSIFAIFIIILLFMLVLGMILIKRDRGNFYAIFVVVWLVCGILLFFTFSYPTIPQFIDKLLN